MESALENIKAITQQLVMAIHSSVLVECTEQSKSKEKKHNKKVCKLQFFLKKAAALNVARRAFLVH